jgi:DnaK suppressor protein
MRALAATQARRRPDRPTLRIGDVDPKQARELLARERRRVEGALGGLRREPGDELSHLDQHPADEATELFEEERDEGVAERLQEELAAIERAERRLEDGTYGVSVESGQPIPDERLEAVPWAERTAEEQERFERRALG